ncbi:MAG: hypothetical protein ACOYOH_26515 [Paracraurococcus sp.]
MLLRPRGQWRDVAVRDESFERMRDAVYAVAAVSGRVGPDTLDRDHDLRGLLFAVFAAGAAKPAECRCGVTRSGPAALPEPAGKAA